MRSTNELAFSSLPLESQAQIRQLVQNLHQLLQHINGKEEIFTVGSISRIVGTELEALNAARSRRKVFLLFKLNADYINQIIDPKLGGYQQSIGHPR